jgi:hypothetical protein
MSMPSRTVSVPRTAGGRPLAGKTPFVSNEVIVTFSADASPQAIQQFARRYNLIQLESEVLLSIGITLSRWRIGGRRSVPAVVVALRSQRIVAGAQPNYLFELQDSVDQSAATDESAATQYGRNRGAGE